MPRLTLSTANTNYNLWDLLSKPDAPNGALAGAGAGNVDNGAHLYAVTFVTALGETVPGPTVSVTVTDKTVNGKVSVTNIPLGPTGTTARKIYRTVAAGSQLKLLTTLSDNTTRTYEDNTADAGLGANAPTRDTSDLGTPPAAMLQLIITADSGNSGNVFVGRRESLTSSDFDVKLPANDSVNLGGAGTIFPGNYWLQGSADAQRVGVAYRPL